MYNKKIVVFPKGYLQIVIQFGLRGEVLISHRTVIIIFRQMNENKSSVIRDVISLMTTSSIIIVERICQSYPLLCYYYLEYKYTVFIIISFVYVIQEVLNW